MLVSVAVSIAFLIISTLAKPLDALEHRALPPSGCAVCNGTENGLYYTVRAAVYRFCEGRP